MDAHKRLEIEFADWIGYPPECCIAASSGTSALHLAFEALQLPLGSGVICPQFTMVACPRAIVMAGHVPQFVDCDETLNMDPDLIEASITDATRAILSVAIYGRTPQRDKIAEIADRHELYIVEDLAESHGLMPHEATDAAAWSFYRNKTINGAEGGLVAFCDAENANLARQLRCLGFTDSHDFIHVPRGHNYRMSDIHAELVLKSLYRANDNITRRNMVAGWYDAAIPSEYHMPHREHAWVYDLRIPGMDAERQTLIVRSLNAAGIAARHAFKPCEENPEFSTGRDITSLVAFRMSREVIYLPIHPDMTRGDVDRIAAEFLRLTDA